MTPLMETALINAAAACVLALPAWLVSRARVPALTRAAWLLVLIKLITPPLWVVRIPSVGTGNIHRAAASEVAKVESNAILPEEFHGDVLPPQHVDSPRQFSSLKPAKRWRFSFEQVCEWCWLGGAVGYLIILAIGTARLRRFAERRTHENAELQQRVIALSARLKLHAAPLVRLVDVTLPPMLCLVGRRPRLLLPAKLWQQLTPDEQDTVIVHELAHLKRGDHWLRAFELIICVLYWWLPLVWWARRELREAGEQLCDALVVATLPDKTRSYAAAFVETIDFISTAQIAAPALACGMGQFANLERRLRMIQQGNIRRTLPRPVAAAMFLAAMVVLPLSATRAQQQVADEPTVNQRTAPSDPTAPQAPRRAERHRAATDATENGAETGKAVRLVLLRFSDAATVARALTVVFPQGTPENGTPPKDRQLSVVADPRTNTVLLSGSVEAIEIAAKVLSVLDTGSPSTSRRAASDVVTGMAGDRAMMGRGGMAATSARENPVVTEDRQAMEKRLDRLETQAASLLEQIHAIKRQLGQTGAGRQ